MVRLYTHVIFLKQKTAYEIRPRDWSSDVCSSDLKETCQDIEYWSKLLQKERNPDKLLATWKTWYDDVGHKERDMFVKYVELANAGARGIGFKEIGRASCRERV